MTRIESVSSGVGKFVRLAGTETITGTKNFTSAGSDGSLTSKHMTVYPKSGGGSASIFLDNQNGQKWEFFANNGGQFGIWDSTNSQQPFTIYPGTVNSMISMFSNNFTSVGNFRIFSDGDVGFILDGANLSPTRGVWNIKQGSDGTFLFDQSGSMNGRFKLGGTGSDYFDWTPDFSNSMFKVQGNGTVTTKNNTLDDGNGNLKLSTVGSGLHVKEGSNATMGVATLSAGAATVSTTKVTSNSRIMLTAQSLGTVATPQSLAVTARSAGTSFTITSSSASDTSVVAWTIIEPA